MATVKIINAIRKQQDILRVAAYCRVSSDSADQLHSYAAQIERYTKLIQQTEGWQLVDIYADEGLTGTRLDKREDFQRMMRDCRKGKIDKILVKSIARFSRNTKDCLVSLRELTALGVTIRFEKENIDTGELSSELMVTISGSLAQEESVSISQNQRWSYQKRMKAGEFVTCKAPFGYELEDGKRLVIIEKEAEIIRWIFDSYLNGMSVYTIADELTMMGIPTTDNNPEWRYSTVNYILHNEKYIGDSLLQKTTVTDAFPSKKVPNKGQRAKYYISNSHPAIVSEETYQAAQALLERRKPYEYEGFNAYPLTRKIACGSCGTTFKRRQSKSGYICWACAKHDKDKNSCDVGRIAETEIEAAFVRMYNKLKRNTGIILHPVITQLNDLRDAIGHGHPEMLAISTEIARMTEQHHVLGKLRAKGLLDADTYIAKCNAANSRLAELRAKRRSILQNEDDDTIERIRELLRIVESGPDNIDRFDENLFADIIEKITAESQERIRFRLIGGIELAEQVAGKGR